jgi:hypothetical protein
LNFELEFKSGIGRKPKNAWYRSSCIYFDSRIYVNW